MRTNKIKGVLSALGFAALLLSSCDSRRLGTIEGNVTGAEGQLLVLEHLTDGTPRMIDTIRLGADGKFKFEPEVEKGPDFFSLRLGNQSISLVIDTLLTPVSVKAEASTLAASYQVSDAQNQELKDAVQMGNRLRGQIANVNKAFNQGEFNRQTARDSILSLVRIYKSQVLEKYIYKTPSNPVSYYLLFESVQGLVIFDANDASDNRVFGAVATGWQYSYPASPRNKVLEKMTLEGQARRRAALLNAQQTDSLFSQGVIETRTFPELNLTNADDHKVSLTSLVDGSGPVLLDFTAYFTQNSPAHNMMLSSLYEKYSGKGLRIYQVCLDYDEHFWKTSADNLPWIAVRDQSVLFDQQGSIQFSVAARTYNVGVLPTSFIIDQNGEIKSRIENDDAQLEIELKKVVK